MDGIQILIFIVVALVYFIQWLARQGGNQNQNPQSRGQGGSNEEEKVRRFMEALGMPTQDQPPPPPKRAEATPPPPPAQRRMAPQPLQQAPPPQPKPAERDYYAIEEKPEMADVDAWGNKIKEMQRKAQEAEERFKSVQRNVAAKGGNPTGLGKAVGDFSKDEPEEQAEADAYAIMAQMEVGKASTLLKLMQTTAGAQQAVVLREVLGPPKGLES